jgi:hypothetical protein
MAMANDSDAPAPILDLVEHREALARRLDDGFVRIEQAIVAGEDVKTWEEFWLTLLAEYEAISDELNAA